ncbi:MAG: hypothetical protein J1F02_07475 [Lachnospiraceae bacterium]|nr:hypothetical protein [Lachnospiraceae bacterium]
MVNCKKIFSFIICIIVLLSMTACASEEKKGEGMATQNTEKNISVKTLFKDTPSHIKIDFSENYTVDADVSFPQITNADVLFAEYNHINEQSLVSVFFNGKTPNKEIYTEDDITSYTDENSEMIVANEYITYRTQDYNYVKYPIENFTPEYDLLSTGRKYNETFMQENLNFMNKEEALNTVSGVLEKLSLNNIAENVEIYAIDYNTLQIEQEKRIQSEIDIQKKMGISPIQNPTDGYQIKDTFTQDDEFYVMYFTMVQNQIPVTQMSYDILSGERSLYGSVIKVLLSPKGIIEFECSGIYKSKGSAESPDVLISAEKAVQRAYEIYNSTISTDIITVNSIDFEYVPAAYNKNHNEVKLIPSWSLNLSYHYESSEKSKDKNSELKDINRMLYINAVNGEEIK